MRNFSPLPFLFCEITQRCTYASRTATSYWLSTSLPTSMMPIGERDVYPYISRCSVCQAPAPVMAFHSQDTEEPDCPSGWAPVWKGFSFVMHSVGAMGGGQQLASTGSCLERFQAHPYIECGSQGTCHYYSNKMSYWLVSTKSVSWQSLVPGGDTLKGEDALTRISRCKVCELRA